MRVSRPGAASAAGLRALALGDGPVALVTGLLSLSAEVAPGEAATLGAGWMSSTAAGRAAAWLGWTAFPVARATFWLAVVEFPSTWNDVVRAPSVWPELAGLWPSSLAGSAAFRRGDRTCGGVGENGRLSRYLA